MNSLPKMFTGIRSFGDGTRGILSSTSVGLALTSRIYSRGVIIESEANI